MNQIAVVLDGLKQKISHGSTFIQRSYNSIGQATFHLPKPVKPETLQAFEAAFKQPLPSEYQTFLELHNGAKLFMLGDEGLVLHPLEEVIEKTIEAKEDGLIDEDYDHYWIIGEINEGYLLIHTDHAKTEDTPYMYWKYHEGSTEDTDAIGQNFGTFLERSMIAQGDIYWEFNSFDVREDDYYVEEETEDVQAGVPIASEERVRIEIEYPIYRQGDFIVSFYTYENGKPDLWWKFDYDTMKQVHQSLMRTLEEPKFHFTEITVFQKEAPLWESEDASGEQIAKRVEHPQIQIMQYDGYQAFVNDLPRPLPGWEKA
ncbi:SMI1/KNR4 family protein [Exiguobacterium sp. s166]|uniref:SMI1/KNR4 family protein n=1 Tax=Exiguobacterium sp. s166 TaxID=2751204 RepID=UPI001BEA5A55|nr:SMI1/KNR4 family protein [Exiguobacterium sp. s166]